MSALYGAAYDPDEAVPQATRDNWRLYAACNDRDPDEFFPGSIRKEREIARYCHGFCPTVVRKSCLESALHADQKHGVAGGMTSKERAALADDFSPWTAA